MTTTITVRACTLGEIRATSPELDWTPVVDPASEQPAEPVRACGLAGLDRAASRAVRATLPAQPGLYLWTARATTPGPSAETARDQEAVIYLGVAAGRWGLADRLASELRYVWNTSAHHGRYLQQWFHGHPRTMLAFDAQPLYAVTEDAATARRLERELLAVAGYATGLTPLANGSSWLSSTPHQVAARDAAWPRAQAAGLLHDEPTP